jgi:hypothetical protein
MGGMHGTLKSSIYRYGMPGKVMSTLNLGLSLEKQRDNRNIFLVQVIIIAFGLTLTEFLQQGSKTALAKPVITVFSIFGVKRCFFIVGSPQKFHEKQNINPRLFFYAGRHNVDGNTGRISILHRASHCQSAIIPADHSRPVISHRSYGDYFCHPRHLLRRVFGSLYDLIYIIKPGSLGKEFG